MTRAPAPGKVNLALVVGAPGETGKHELTTVYQRLDVFDRVTVEPARALRVEGFPADTLVAGALRALAAEAGVEPRWRAVIRKRLPVSAGLGGGSSDAATALRLANRLLDRPLERERLHRVAASVGSDVPFFLSPGPQLGEGDGTRLTPLALPQDFWVLLLVPDGVRKRSTAAVYEEFDASEGATAYSERRRALLDALAAVRRAEDLARLPPNDLAASPLVDELRAAGAFRADVSGAGPALYALFRKRGEAHRAAFRMRAHGRVRITVPAWYG